ncbi:MAG TPA: TIGR02450 family Trp-rich protein [Thiopseudomonas sp.]|nr:TIGR02450 family Trp-rich protein [Thiopseudomonas sp.]HZJ92672.1 TIGR02450 family Trp-rich protein [Thiopseudomonas sp.]
MHQINPKKLLHSKWTAVRPVNKEKHFLVTELKFDEEGNVIHCLLEAVISNREEAIDWQDLKNTEHWRQGWQ